MKTWTTEIKTHLADREFLVSLGVSFFVLAISLFVNYYAGVYATVHASSPVTDLILSNIRVYDVDGIFIYGSIAMWVFFAFLMFRRPKEIPFTFKALSLFILIRALFITLTHIGPFYPAVLIHSSFMNKFDPGADLFFSGHTGLPFLFALIFWKKKSLRIFFLCASIIFGAAVLMGHLHYSIDVLGAFFITYSIFHMAEFFFPKDRKRFYA